MAATQTVAESERETPVVKLPGLREAIGQVFSVVSKPIESLSETDTGYFGPGSVTWRIQRDPSMSVGGIASLFHQALHPVAMSSVAQHSDFSHNAWMRTWRTSEWVMTVVFGSKKAADVAGDRVRRLHRSISGTDPVTGRDYRADDQHLLQYIHMVIVEYTLRTYETYAHRLTPEDADRLVVEMKAMGRQVDLNEELMPDSIAEVRDYLEKIEPELQMTEPAMAFFQAFLHAKMPITMRGIWFFHLVGMLALLPPKVRRMYRAPRWIPAGPLTRFTIRMALRVMNVAYLAFPPIRRARRHLDALQ